MKAAFYTLGCKVNQYESQAMSERLKNNGYEITDCADEADVYIINSCTVTAQADQKTRQTVRRFKRAHPQAAVVLTGCMPQAYPEKAAELFEADIVTGNRGEDKIAALLDEFFKNGRRVVKINSHENGELFESASISRFDERTRAYVKIQDGCNRFCSYCIIPTSRGRVRSRPLGELKAELEALAANGYCEVVLVGINLSSYGSDSGESFPEAVRLADEINGIKRVRLGSLEPDHLTDEVIEQLAMCRKLCPQFHLSLQSGCDSTLRRMNRHYTAAEYRAICRKLRSTFPDCTITTDVMVGFAGESDADFAESLDFVKEIAFEKVHVFPYSVRKGTRAEKLDGHVEKCVKEKRCRVMIDESEKIRREFFRMQTGRTVKVLFESKAEDGYIFGHTENFTPVRVKSGKDLCGKIAEVKITDASGGDFCTGELV